MQFSKYNLNSNFYTSYLKNKFMKLRCQILLSWILAGVLAVSCTNDSEEKLLKNQSAIIDAAACQTNTISYLRDVQPIFNANCIVCHNAVLLRNGYNLANYTEAVKVASKGRIPAAIMHIGPYKMPKNAPKLSNCDISKIQAWLDAGMPNN
jgi:mono/diheme cytochrome c family protein